MSHKIFMNRIHTNGQFKSRWGAKMMRDVNWKTVTQIKYWQLLKPLNKLLKSGMRESQVRNNWLRRIMSSNRFWNTGVGQAIGFIGKKRCSEVAQVIYRSVRIRLDSKGGPLSRSLGLLSTHCPLHHILFTAAQSCHALLGSVTHLVWHTTDGDLSLTFACKFSCAHLWCYKKNPIITKIVSLKICCTKLLSLSFEISYLMDWNGGLSLLLVRGKKMNIIISGLTMK